MIGISRNSSVIKRHGRAFTLDLISSTIGTSGFPTKEGAGQHQPITPGFGYLPRKFVGHPYSYDTSGDVQRTVGMLKRI